jgi:predicted DNA-binding protein YlxM (UPF0122 family)
MHVDLGYSAVKIASLIKVNRNTINQDIKWCYKKIHEQQCFSTEEILEKQLYRFELQRERLVSSLKENNRVKTNLSIEKLILDIDSKIAMIMLKIIIS